MSGTLERIYQEHRRGLFLLALSITHCPADAEDAVHDAFARLCRCDLPQGNGTISYVFAAVRNAALDRWRRNSDSSGHLGSMALRPCMEPSQEPEARERQRSIAEVIDALEDDLRTVVLLRVFAGLTFRQIGEMTGAPLQTIASRYSAALERLRPLLRQWI